MPHLPSTYMPMQHQQYEMNQQVHVPVQQLQHFSPPLSPTSAAAAAAAAGAAAAAADDAEACEMGSAGNSDTDTANGEKHHCHWIGCDRVYDKVDQLGRHILSIHVSKV